MEYSIFFGIEVMNAKYPNMPNIQICKIIKYLY